MQVGRIASPPSLTRSQAPAGAGALAEPTDRFEASTPAEPDLKALRQAAAVATPYYDEARDLAAQQTYYQGIDAQTGPTQMFEQVGQLVRRTHREKLGYDPEKRLFPWVDLRPNLRLQSIYSDQAVATDAPIHHTKQGDFIVKTRIQTVRKRPGKPDMPKLVNRKIDYRSQAQEWGKALLGNPLDAPAIAAKIAAVEGKNFYNCEHVVPQHFFDHQRTPKGDLHHLFTSETYSNSLRGHRRYSDLEHSSADRVPQGWAPKRGETFEPDAGKGAVARATLYFLLRYPGMIGDQPEEYSVKDLETLLRWHREDPVSLHEKHRNQAIAELQGNRNPLIDHPEWAERIDFSQGFYSAQPRK